MAGLQEIRRKLPTRFLERLEQQFEQKQLEYILKGFDSERKTIIRINTLKTDTQNIMNTLRTQGVQFERIPFLPNTLIIKNKNESFFEALDMYVSGEIYFQGISSQLPVLFLDPQPGENILDVSAAPGSKTTQIAIQMKNQGSILANEIDEIRHQRLLYNIQKQGCSIIQTRLGDGIALGHEYPETFDNVLLDAPCSAEGRISMKNPRTYRFWREKNIIKNAKLQRRLFVSAVKALKKGGILVYSTCTLAPEENEMILDWAIKRFQGELTIEKISLDWKYLLPVLTSFEEKTFSHSVCNALKAAPSELSEGFFIAKFKKI